MEMDFKKVLFQNARGEAISARLDLPADKKPVAYALFAHCFTCTKNFKAVVHINRALAKEGIAALRFDFTGLGESEGDFAETSFSTNVADLVSAARYLEAHFEAPKILIGHSLGGAAVLRAAEQIPSSVAIATIAAPAEAAHLTRLLGSTREEIEREGEAEINLGTGRSFKITREFLHDLERTGMRESIGRLNRALLIFHSPVDRIVGIENACRIFEAARHPKSFISLDDADHLLSGREDSIYTGSVLAAWSQRYLGIGMKEG
jgi:putative redox protein